MNDYITVLSVSEGKYEEKHSRFLARLVSCDSEEAAAEIMQKLHSEYWDARHIVYAYILKDGTSRFSDDGEPHGTAGKPVYDALAGSGIRNSMLSVTRYFGGILLGTGGLVRAYSAAAKTAINAASPVLMCQSIVYAIKCQYSEHAKLTRIINECGGNIENIDFSAEVTVRSAFKITDTDNFLKKLKDGFSAKLNATEIESGYSAFNLK